MNQNPNPPEQIDVKYLSTAKKVVTEKYSVPMTPQMRMRYMEEALSLLSEIDQDEEQMKSLVSKAKALIKEKKTRHRGMQLELKKGKFEREGEIYEIFFPHLKPPKIGRYTALGELVDTRFPTWDEMQMDLVIEASNAEVEHADAQHFEDVEATAVDIELDTDDDMDIQH